MVQINGKDINAAGVTIQAYLEQIGLGSCPVAIEHNGTIIHYASRAKIVLADGDKMEIVHFVGGG